MGASPGRAAADSDSPAAPRVPENKITRRKSAFPPLPSRQKVHRGISLGGRDETPQASPESGLAPG